MGKNYILPLLNLVLNDIYVFKNKKKNPSIWVVIEVFFIVAQN